MNAECFSLLAVLSSLKSKCVVKWAPPTEATPFSVASAACIALLELFEGGRCAAAWCSGVRSASPVGLGMSSKSINPSPLDCLE